MEPTIKILGIFFKKDHGIVNWEQTFLNDQNEEQSEIQSISFPIYIDANIETANDITNEYVIEHIKKNLAFKSRCK